MLIPVTKITTFKELKCGDLFSLMNPIDTDIWCKTPFADMEAHNNKYTNTEGAFCTAICVTSEEQRYMQCNPEIPVVSIDFKKLLEGTQ